MQRKNYFVISISLILLLAVGLFTAYHLNPELGVSFAQEENPTIDLTEDTKSEASTITGKNVALISTLNNPYQIADIAEAANPATVYIQVKWPAQEQSPSYWRTDPFSFFFDFWSMQPFQKIPSERISQGTGFIIDNSGIILTNQHVVGNVDENQKVTVTVNSPQISGEFEADILGSDERLDLAVLKIEGDKPFPTVTLGDSEKSRPGEWVIAIGNPYGKQLDHTVTVGVLSAKGREIQIMGTDGTVQKYKNLMQTDAAINSGNSGGPLLNIEGEVIGINTAVHAEAQGIGFAIPINVAKDVLQELIETGEVKLPPLPWLGIYFLSIDDDLAQQLSLPDTKGILITDVIIDSPAYKAGLKARDIVRRFDDVDINNSDDLVNAIADYKPGDEVILTIFREGKTQLITITIGDTPEQLRD